MNDQSRNRKATITLGDLVEALYDEVIALPLSDPAKQSLVAIMIGDMMHREGSTIFFQARLPGKIHLDAA